MYNPRRQTINCLNAQVYVLYVKINFLPHSEHSMLLLERPVGEWCTAK
jgi:hypothetical protein